MYAIVLLHIILPTLQKIIYSTRKKIYIKKKRLLLPLLETKVPQQKALRFQREMNTNIKI